MTPVTPEDFLRRLLETASGRKRVLAHDYRAAFAEMCPALPPPEARTKIAGWLSLLAETGDIVLLRGKRLYDRSESGDLPAWVELDRPGELSEPLPVDPESFAWAPELRFACTVHDARQLRVLLRVQQFLADGGRQRSMIPVKERSVELFGREKRLEMIKNSALFLSLPSGAKLGLSADSQAWLGKELASKVGNWFERGIRLPQDLVGWDQLNENEGIFTKV